MSSKAQERLTDAVKQNKHIRFERQRALRALAAICRLEGKPIVIPFAIAAQVTDEDQVNILFDRKTGTYTVKLENEDADSLGSTSVGVELQEREGDVGGPVPEEQHVGVSEEVQRGDQHDHQED